MNKAILYLTFLFSLFLYKVNAITTDTIVKTEINSKSDTTFVNEAPSNIDYEETQFEPGLFLFMVFGLILSLVCIGAGLFISFLIFLLITGLISVGIISTSIIVGLHKKSFENGFKVFTILTTGVLGLLFGSTVFVLLAKIQHWWTFKTALILGGTSGLLSGVAFGFIIFFTIKRLTKYFINKLNLTVDIK